jgi:hypothetical protein
MATVAADKCEENGEDGKEGVAEVMVVVTVDLPEAEEVDEAAVVLVGEGRFCRRGGGGGGGGRITACRSRTVRCWMKYPERNSNTVKTKTFHKIKIKI